MKKILTFAACIAICLSVTACGGKKESSSAAKQESRAAVEMSSREESSAAESMAAESSEADESVEEANSDTDDSSGATGVAASFTTLEEYVEANKETFETLKGSLKNSGMNLNITARENSLVYTYTFDKEITDPATIKTGLDKGLETQKDTYESVCESLRTAIPSVESVIVEYYDVDGNLITSREYK